LGHCFPFAIWTSERLPPLVVSDFAPFHSRRKTFYRLVGPFLSNFQRVSGQIIQSLFPRGGRPSSDFSFMFLFFVIGWNPPLLRIPFRGYIVLRYFPLATDASFLFLFLQEAVRRKVVAALFKAAEMSIAPPVVFGNMEVI